MYLPFVPYAKQKDNKPWLIFDDTYDNDIVRIYWLCSTLWAGYVSFTISKSDI